MSKLTTEQLLADLANELQVRDRQAHELAHQRARIVELERQLASLKAEAITKEIGGGARAGGVVRRNRWRKVGCRVGPRTLFKLGYSWPWGLWPPNLG